MKAARKLLALAYSPEDNTLHTITLATKLLTLIKTNTNSVAFSPQANYTDFGTANCWRNLVPTFADRGLSRGQRGGSRTVVNLNFLDQSLYFSFKLPLIYPHEAEWTPFETHCYSENLAASGNVLGTSVYAARKSDQ
jgi:hypothetical protein